MNCWMIWAVDIASGTVLLVDMDGGYITEGVLMLTLAVVYRWYPADIGGGYNY